MAYASLKDAPSRATGDGEWGTGGDAAGGGAGAAAGLCARPSAGRRVRPCRVLSANATDPLFLGHALNLLFMVLYVLLDFSRGWDAANQTVVSVGFIVLGAGYVADAVLYLASWGEEWPTGAAAWGEALNIAGSVIYMASSVMYLYQSNDADSSAVFIIEAAATVIFLVDGLVYYAAWLAAEPVAPRKGCHWRDINLWGHVLNIVPAAIYVMSAINGLLVHFSSRDALVTGAAGNPQPPPPGGGGAGGGGVGAAAAAVATAAAAAAAGGLGEWRPERPTSIMRAMTKVYIWGDVLWTVDAAILVAAWAKDTCVPEEEEEEQEGQGQGGATDGAGGGGDGFAGADKLGGGAGALLGGARDAP
jgi:hypothetical protein